MMLTKIEGRPFELAVTIVMTKVSSVSMYGLPR